MDVFSPTVLRYLENLVPPRPVELHRMESDAAETKFPIIGPALGQFCYLVARMIQARRVFEMGSGYGYSTAWLALAVEENGGGTVFHTVWDEALSQRARAHLQALGLAGLVQFEVRESVAALREAQGPFDLIFSDINKEGYLDSLPVVAEKLRPGGVLLVDNILWYGRIFNGTDRSPATEIIRQFTLAVMQDPGWTASIIPIRDGILMAMKK